MSRQNGCFRPPVHTFTSGFFLTRTEASHKELQNCVCDASFTLLAQHKEKRTASLDEPGSDTVDEQGYRKYRESS